MYRQPQDSSTWCLIYIHWKDLGTMNGWMCISEQWWRVSFSIFNVPCLGMWRTNSELGPTGANKYEVPLWAKYWSLTFCLSSVSLYASEHRLRNPRAERKIFLGWEMRDLTSCSFPEKWRLCRYMKVPLCPNALPCGFYARRHSLEPSLEKDSSCAEMQTDGLRLACFTHRGLLYQGDNISRASQPSCLTVSNESR